MIVKDKVVIGSWGGELSGCCGPIFGVNAQTGEVEWQFDTNASDERSKNSWGNDSWKVGGNGGWMTGTYDPENQLHLVGNGQSGSGLRLVRRQLDDRRPASWA